VTVAMSDHDYGLLLEAVGWIEQYAGVDAPDYPHMARIAEVVTNISKRWQPDREVAPGPAGGRTDFSTLRRPRDWCRRNIGRSGRLPPSRPATPPRRNPIGRGRWILTAPRPAVKLTVDWRDTGGPHRVQVWLVTAIATGFARKDRGPQALGGCDQSGSPVA
jgi:hypothetical protein